VFLIDAEHDGLLVAVVAFLEEGRDLLCCKKGAVVENQRAVEISFGVAVRPICVAPEKWFRISRHAESSAALPRWHSSITIRSKKSFENSLNSFWRSSGPVIA
jgi:hypothetical protein